MKQEKHIYDMPNMGCMLGVAFQRLYTSLESTLRETLPEISVPEYLILRVVYSQEGLQPCDIGERLGKDKGAVSRGVSSLVAKQFLRTETVSHKCLRVYLSDKGRGIWPAIHEVAQRKQEELASVLSDKELTELKRILQKIINLN
ncbi:MAG: MarR family winged helix-turn-helix transcriptional regulator [Muribaculaceae bacterium]|nr:MarR family winged helix-turn-helix transcriptional regulator [Muribaculaceae bacterium]